MLLGQDMPLLYVLFPTFKETKNFEIVFSFFEGIGQTINDPIQLLNYIKIQLSQKIEQLTDYIYIDLANGVIQGCYNQHKEDIEFFLDNALNDIFWEQHFPRLQWNIGFDEKGFNRLIRSFKNNKIITNQYLTLADGRRMDLLSIDQIIKFLSLLEKKENNIPSIISILRMLTINKEKDICYKNNLAEFSLNFFVKFDWKLIEQFNEYIISSILDYTFSNTSNIEKIMTILSQLILFKKESLEIYSLYESNKYIKPFLNHYPKESLDIIYQLDKYNSYNSAIYLLRYDHDRTSETNDLLLNIPDDILLDWCTISADDRLLFMASICKILPNAKSSDHIAMKFSSIARSLFEKTNKKEEMLDIWIDRLYPRLSVGSRANIIRSRALYFNCLKESQDKKTITLINEAMSKLEKLAVDEEERERKRNIDIYERFE